MRCDRAADTLALLVEHDVGGAASSGAPDVDPAALGHIERCLRCQAQLAQHRKLRRNMARLRSERVVPSPGLLDQLLAAVDAAAESPTARGAWARHRAAYVAAATAATAAGAVLLASRSRRIRLAPAS